MNCDGETSFLGQLEAFRKYKAKGFRVILTKILELNVFKEVRIFLIPLSISFLNTKILGFLPWPNIRSKMKKIKDQKIIGKFLDKLRKLYQNGTVNQKF